MTESLSRNRPFAGGEGWARGSGTMRIARSSLVLSVVSLLLLSSTMGCNNDDGVTQPPYAFLYVKVITSGGDLDNSYDILIGDQRRSVVGNTNVVISITPGSYTVQIGDVAPNCTVDGPASRPIEVANKASVTVQFAVTCFPTGFAVKVQTTGEDSPNSYTLMMTGRPAQSLPVDGTVTVTRLAPGPYTLEIVSPIPTCTTAGSSRIETTLAINSIAPVLFEMRCVSPLRLEKIAYVSDTVIGSETTRYLTLADPDGTSQVRIAEGESPSWAPDGRRFAYSGETCDFYYYFYTFCISAVRIRDPETGRDASVAYSNSRMIPAWSPTGNLIAHVEQAVGKLFVGSVSGGERFQVLLPSGVRALDVAWSPDASTLAFSCMTSEIRPQICTARLNGSDFTQLTTGAESKSHPAWSRDGKTIAFAVEGATRSEIVLMPASGGSTVSVTEGFDPAWSRDGSQLIFARRDGLFTINPDGSGLKRISSGKHHAPSWRP